MFRLPSHLTLPSAVWIELRDDSCQQTLGQRVCFVSMLLSIIHNHCNHISRQKLSEILPFLSFFCLFVCFLIVCSLETPGNEVRTQTLRFFSGFATDSLALLGTGCTHDLWRTINLCPCKSFFSLKTKLFDICWRCSFSSFAVGFVGRIAEASKRGICTAKARKN